MEVNKKRLSDIFGVSVRTIQNWQDQGMPVARGGGKGNEVLYDSAAATALDRLMDTAPGAVSAASQASDTDDLMNTPV